MQPKFFKGKYQDSLTLFNLPLQVATEREIARQQYSSLGQSLSDWSMRLKDFPHPALSTNNIVGQVIGPFLFAASMFSYVPVVSFCQRSACVLPVFCLLSYNTCTVFATLLVAGTEIVWVDFACLFQHAIVSQHAGSSDQASSIHGVSR